MSGTGWQRLETESKRLALAAVRAAEARGMRARWGESDNGYYFEAACDPLTLLDIAGTAKLSLRQRVRPVEVPEVPQLREAVRPVANGRVEAVLGELVEAVREEASAIAAEMGQDEVYPLVLATSLGSCIAALENARAAVVADIAATDPELAGHAEEAHRALLRMRNG